MRTLPKRFRKNVWYQVGGDMSPERHGGVIARWDGNAVEIREIQPVVECVGEREGAEAGHPFWSKEGWYDDDDIREILRTRNERGWAPLDYVGLDIAPDARLTIALRFQVAEAALSYGWKTDDGPAGWWRDVSPGRASWWGGAMARDGRVADTEYRRLLKEYASE